MKNNNVFQFLMIFAVICSSLTAMAQMPDSLLTQIINTPKKDLISVMGKYEVTSQVLRTENLVFHNDSELIFTNYSFPYVIIAAKNLKFNAPAIKATVKFGSYDIVVLKGSKGASGATGANGSGNGVRGGNGGSGGVGGNGNSQNTPDIYLIIDNISTDYGDITSFDWQVFTSGLEGGQGGDGGNGGTGGNGSGGRNSRSNAFHCTRGASNGGAGGNGGQGGIGGNGGTGGNAGNIILVGNTAVTQKLTYVQFLLNGGTGGKAGLPGVSGSGGSGGSGGKGSTHCSGADRGSNGSSPSALGEGTKGQNGQNGEVKIINQDVATLF
ncbi:hypothetical protein [Flavobacterium sp.]|uniref:hypothetical protein n=1 Tax=Flavobacterium sp. TaxID=239 RepID=UPI0025C2AA6C|nr:hypothetical protein [Flavobacterium sp.]